MTKRLSLTASVLAALFTLSAGAVLAEIQDGIAYDIYQKDGRLCTWVDLAAFLDGHEISRLRDGIDLMFDCRLTLSIPRKFLGDNVITRARHRLRITYRPVSESFELQNSLSPTAPPRTFLSILSLRNHLRDSVEIRLLPMDSLNPESHYVLHLEITSISLTDINLAPSEESREATSPLTYLFRSFLEATGYGRRDYETRSRPFSLSETNP